MKQFATLIALHALALPALAAPLAQWDFNSDDGLVSTGTLAPQVGAGTLGLAGGATGFFTSGSPSDPAGFPLDSAWSVGHYPAQGSGSGTAGLQGFVSTAGMAHVTVAFDYKTQPSGNKWFTLQASTDSGGSWLDVATFGVAAADTWYSQTIDVSSVLPTVDDQAGFGFRVVAVFKPGTSAYEASEAGYNGDFGLEYDVLTVGAAPVPEPAALALMLAGFAVTGVFAAGQRAGRQQGH